MKKISLCVPTYNRPDTLKQLINSFLKQDYPNKELVISDDTPNESIKDLVKAYSNKQLKYFHNEQALGFSQNLLKSMERSSGDYIILLGDDDLLVTKSVLSDYVNVFNTKPSVGFVYSNMVQFSNTLDIDYVITFTLRDKLFHKGKEAIDHMLVRSIYIGGIGVRKSRDLRKFYSEKKILHPQVEFIGNIISNHDAYLFAKYHIGFRSHEDQIIFRALKNKKIRQEGHHMTVELFDIFRHLNKQYALYMSFDNIARQLIDLQIVMLFKEKNILGVKEMEKNYRKFCELSEIARNSIKFKSAFLLAKFLPSLSIFVARSFVLRLLAFKNKEIYGQFQKKLMKMIVD